jgi:predicted phosphoribosyltransferase
MRHVGELAYHAYHAFENRLDAGRIVGALLAQGECAFDVVVAIPNGGVAVALPIAERFETPLDVVLVRKLPFPDDPEAGFGAITLRRSMVLNDRAVAHAGLTPADVRAIVDATIAGLEAREQVLSLARKPAALAGSAVLIVDDGLASGVTMRAAIGEMERAGARSVSVAVPAGPASTIDIVEPLVRAVYCAVAQVDGSFAVASYYRRWSDLADEDVVAMLQAARAKREGEAR